MLVYMDPLGIENEALRSHELFFLPDHLGVSNILRTTLS